MRQLLKNLLDECKQCDDYYQENVGMIREEGTLLTDEQVEAIFVELSDRHRHHDV